MMTLQQLTGVTFSSSYGPTFYKQVGLGKMAFAYAVRFQRFHLHEIMKANELFIGYQQRRFSCHRSYRHDHT